MATVNENELMKVISNIASDGFTFNYYDREINLLELLPQVYKSIHDFRAMCNSSGSELAPLYDGLTHLLDNQFISTCDVETLGKFEGYFNITPNGTDTIDERKFRVLAKLNDSPPYTDKYLEKRLNELCGEGYWRVHRDYADYRLIVEVSLDSKANTETVMDIVREIIPANLELDVREYQSRHSELIAFTHNQLATYTHDSIKYAEMFE